MIGPGTGGFSVDRPGPENPRFIPSAAPEPPVRVRAVTILEQDPARLRWERTHDGLWLRAGSITEHRQAAVGWSEVGVCWAGTCHDLKDVTDWSDGAEAEDTRRERYGPVVS